MLQKGKTHIYYSITDGLTDPQQLRTLVRLYLSEPEGLIVPHLLDVPEERLLTLLTRVAV